MKTATTIMVLFAVACMPLFALHCAWCNQPMLEDHRVCKNCGKTKGTHPPGTEHHKPAYKAYSPSEETAPAVQNHNTYPRYNHKDDCGDNVLAGMGRGLATASLAPLNFIRGMGTGCAWMETANLSGGDVGLYGVLFFISGGAVVGTFATCADVINGLLDTMSFGCYGNWLYDSPESGRPTPWIWERKWFDTKIPWINR